MQKIAVITGCAGFLGSTFTQKLLQEGWYVYGIDSINYMSNYKYIKELKKTFPDTFKFVKEDIVTLTWLPDCDIVFNFAAETDVDNGNTDCLNFVRTNIDGVRNLLEVITNKTAVKTDKPIFFQISTDEVYGDTEYGMFDESSNINPSNPYAATKASADLLIKSWARTHNTQYVIVRPSNNYGYNQYHEKLIPLAIKQLSRSKKIRVHDKGLPVRTWTNAEDTSEAIYLIARVGELNEIYNISSGFEQRNIDVVSKIITNFFDEKVDIKDYIDYTYNRPGQDVRYAIMCNPVKDLGWFSKVDFDLELKSLVYEYKKEFTW